MMRGRDALKAVLATALGLGYVPIAPGTAGALAGVAGFVAIAVLAPAAMHVWLIAAALAAVCLSALWLGPWAQRHWDNPDPQAFVLDEVAGFLVTVLLFRPLAAGLPATVLWAFGVTRFFDIVKPPPVRQLERLPGGWGILLDDVCASLYAAATLHLLFALFPGLFGLGCC